MRSACDLCRKSRTKCKGGSPCQKCAESGSRCHYSPSLRNGRLRAKKPDNEVSSRGSTISTEDNTFLQQSNAQVEENQEAIIRNLENPEHNVPGVTDAMSVTPPSSTEPPSLDFLNLAAGEMNLWEDMWEPGPNSLNPPMLLPLSLDQPLMLQNQQAANRCSCLRTQFQSIAELSEYYHYDRIPMDSVLEITRKILQSTSQYIACQLCHKTSFGFILINIAMQRLALIHCCFARNSLRYVKEPRISLGTFQLSEEEDRIHKKMLVLSSTGRIKTVLAELESVVGDYHERRPNKELATLTGKSNLQWVLEIIKTMKRRLHHCVAAVEDEEWGFKDFPDLVCE